MAASLWRCSLPASTISPESVPVTAPVPDHAPEQPRASASLVLLRDGAAGLEVLLLRRHANSRVHGGLHVFPGGKLDAADCAADALATLDQDAATLHRRLGEPGLAPEHAAGIFLAALRETHEEAGLLLAEGATPARQAQLAAAQRSGQPLAVALRALGLRWQTRAVLPCIFEALEAGWQGDFPGGLSANAPLAGTYFNLRKTTIYGGSNEVQRNIVAQTLLG